MTETTNCENCGRVIGAFDSPHVWEQHVVCPTCWARLSATPSATPLQTEVPLETTSFLRQSRLVLAVAVVIILIVGGIGAAFILGYSHLSSMPEKTASPMPRPAIKAPHAVALVVPVKQPVAPLPARIAVKAKASTAFPKTSAPLPKRIIPARAIAPLPAIVPTRPRPLSLTAANPSVDINRATARKVLRAITRGVNFLLKQENGKHYWNDGLDWVGTPEHGGETALVLEALIDINQSLHPPQLYSFSPRMHKALNYLAALNTQATYAASFQAQALTLLPNVKRKAYMAALNRDRRYLFRAMIHGGSFSYSWQQDGFLWDNSNTQYGVLGIWACAHAGLKVLTTQWRLLALHWRHTQHMDGSWGYTSDHTHPQSFTPAGVASLFISDEFINATDLNIHPHPDVNIVRGLRWLNTHFNPTTINQYVMYGYERVGLASGIKYFGKHNWYRDYVSTLLATQKSNGSWSSNFPAPQQGNHIIGTAYSLLVLDRGLNPVFINKLQYSSHFYGQWNARQRDAANITSYLSHEMETPLNWQVVTTTSPVSQWLDSPILLITGHKNPHFTAPVLSKLRQYIQAGGMVVCSCDGDSKRFRRAMIQAGESCVRNSFKFRPVPATSPLMTMQPWFHIASPLLAISNGVRHLWIISPSDMAGVWQSRLHNHKQYWELPLNFYLYATGKGYLANRLQSLSVPRPDEPAVRKLSVGLLSFHGNWNPEPGAWPRLAAMLAAYDRTDVSLQSIAPAQLNAARAGILPLVHLTGVGGIAFSTADIAALRVYLNAGGMLFADSSGGKTAFTHSCALLIQSLYPGSKLEDIPAHSPLITGTIPGGVNASKVTYRQYGADANHPRTTPQLFGIRLNHRWAVVFSSKDITSGLLGTNTWAIRGYSPRSAQSLACNILMYAIAHRVNASAHLPAH